ncbi:sensor histidine kinase [Anaerorhabdus sp.]|uniref:sensor histidine kinase n=1 Tax=Anaerorhabdus sp. TaxID=1872524 RepID=UPI002FCC39F5
MIQAFFAFFVSLYIGLIIPIIICFLGIVTFFFAFILSKKNEIYKLYNYILIYAIISEIIISLYLGYEWGFQSYLFIIILMSFTFLYIYKTYHDLILYSLTIFIMVVLCYLICNVLNYYIQPSTVYPESVVFFVRSINIVLVSSIIFMYTLVFLTKITQLQNQIKEDNKKIVKNQQLVTMLAQIKPHFMYNTLSSINNLIEANPKAAQELLCYFSKYMRSNIDNLTNEELIPFEKELDHILTYINITSICYEKEILLELELDETNFSIPPLTLQPIVENAIIHGNLINVPKSKVIIRSKRNSDETIIQIENNGESLSPIAKVENKKSVGLTNVEFRLKTLSHGRLEIRDNNQGTIVTIYIPTSAKIANSKN